MFSNLSENLSSFLCLVISNLLFADVFDLDDSEICGVHANDLFTKFNRIFKIYGIHGKRHYFEEEVKFILNL